VNTNDSEIFLFSAQDPKCRYRVLLPEASWHTAYDACRVDSNWTLAKISSITEMYLIDLVLQEIEELIRHTLVRYVHEMKSIR
jgi:hypothetical protein